MDHLFSSDLCQIIIYQILSCIYFIWKKFFFLIIKRYEKFKK